MDPSDVRGLVDVLILVVITLGGALAALCFGRSMAETDPSLWKVDADHPDQHEPTDAAYAPPMVAPHQWQYR
jgi:hypothetical protein